MLRDLHFAFRTLRRAPGSTTLAILVLALGVGANLVVFTLIHGILIEPLDYARPDALVRVFGNEAESGRDRQRLSQEMAVALRQVESFEGIAAARNMGMSITDAERPSNPLMRQVSTGYFDLLGITPRLGRTFNAEEHAKGLRVTVLHEGFWQSHFGGDPKILGKTIELAGEPYEVVGVLPASYRNPSFSQPPVLWLPQVETAEPDRRASNQVVIGRLRQGASLEEAHHEADAILAGLAGAHPEVYGHRGLRLMPLHDAVVESIEPMLLTLVVTVAFVLLVACLNVAHILLARALGRRRELGVRLALGAGSWHLTRQTLMESLLLSAAGTLGGLLIAFWSVDPLEHLLPSNLPVPLWERVAIEPTMVIFAAALALAISLGIALVPLGLVRNNIHKVLGAGAARAAGGQGRRRARAALVVAEIAISMVLLVGAGLMVRTMSALRALDLGFEPAGVLAGRVGARGPGFNTPDRWAEFHRQVTENLEALPGVASVGMCEFLPMFAAGFGNTVPVAPPESDLVAEARPRAVALSITSGYFETFGQPLLGGRGPELGDTAETPAVAVVSRTLARQVWGDTDPLGRELVVGEGDETRTVRVVGVAGDLRGLLDAPEPPPILYLPLAQRPISNLSLFVRAAPGAPLPEIPAIEDAIWAISGDVPVYSFVTLEQLVADLEWRPRFLVQLLGVFAFLALVLAATGLYAVLASTVAERHREIGIRMAVGASRDDILRLVEREALRLSVIGVVLGGAAALGLSRFLASQLYGVSAGDPLTYLGLALALTTVAFLASHLPARKATRVDPVMALRAE